MSGIVLTNLDGDDEGSRILRRALAIEATRHCGLLAARQLAAEQVRAEDRAAFAGAGPGAAAPEPPAELLTVKETAAVLRAQPNYVYELLARGELPAVRVGRKKLVRRTDLDAFVRRGGTTSDDDD